MTFELAVEPEVFAVIAGQPLTKLPTDLFIPPDALEILLDTFTGPLDLLLYLIRQQDIDIMNIPIARITQQYMRYIELLEKHTMELAADYLVMAALLAEIKSRLLLPTPASAQNEAEEDPRMELVRRLQAYEQFKHAARELDQLIRFERDVFQVEAVIGGESVEKIEPEVALSSLVLAMVNVLQLQNQLMNHQITRELLSVNDRMTLVLQRVRQEKLVEFTQLFNYAEGRMGLVVTLLAILELTKQSLIILTQTMAYSSIHLQENHDG